MHDTLVINLTSKTRTEFLEGREHLVVPAVILTEGVHEGSQGAILYTNEELGKEPTSWDHMPVVVNHPEKDGKPVRARDPKVLDETKVGILLNTVHNEKLKTECWFDKERLKNIAPTVFEALSKGQKVEVSTGLSMDLDKTPGEFAGTKYIGIARNFKPDHLAILPSTKGACSIEKGAGLLANAEKATVDNEASFRSIEVQCNRLLRDKFTKPGYYWEGWVEEVYDGFFIYRSDSKYYKQAYTIEKDVVSLSGEPEEVNRVVEFRRVANNEYVGNTTGVFISNAEKRKMDKKQKVDTLITNGAWAETDREWLMGWDEPKLDAAISKLPKKDEKPVQNQAVDGATSKEVKSVTPTEQPKVALKDVIANSDPAVQEAWEEMQADLNSTKDELIKTIIANKANEFPEAELKAMKIPQLRRLSKLCTPVTNAASNGTDYSLAGGTGQTVVYNKDSKEQPLGIMSTAPEPLETTKK